MKKLLFLLIIIGISSQLSAKLKEKDLVGKWKYSVVSDQEKMTGVFKFVLTDKKLSGEVITDDGYTMPITKIVIQENNVLFLEIQTDTEKYQIKVNVDGKTFKGTGSSSQGEAPITGEKVK